MERRHDNIKTFTTVNITAHKMKFSIRDFFSKCDPPTIF